MSKEETTVRLKKSTVQRLNAYKATRPLGMTHDDAINELLDKDTKKKEK